VQKHKSLIFVAVALAAMLIYLVPFDQISAAAQKGGNSNGSNHGSGNGGGNQGNDNGNGHANGGDQGKGKKCGIEKYEATSCPK